MNHFSVVDRVVVLTGATGYLGQQMTKDLISQGAKVAVLSQQIEKARQLCATVNNENAQPFEVNIADDDSVAHCLKAVDEMFGQINVLINNACFCSGQSFDAMRSDDWDCDMDGTVKAAHRCLMGALPYLEKSSSPRVINITSMYGMVVPNPEVYAKESDTNPMGYGVGKAAMIHYSKYAAMKLANKKITVNNVSYGPFPNPEKVKDQSFINALSNKTFLKRVGNAEDVTAPIIFLSMPASGYVTGQNIVVDGGWTTW